MITSTEALVKMLKLLRTILEEGDSDSDVKEMVEESIKNCASAVGELDIELVKVRKVKPTTLTEKIHEKGLRLLYPFRESTLLKLQQIVTDMRENLMLAIDILQVWVFHLCHLLKTDLITFSNTNLPRYTTSLTFQELKEMATHLDHVEAGIASIGHSVDYIKAQHIGMYHIEDLMSPHYCES